MIKSMTSYGHGEYIIDERKCTVDIRSVNHRYFDINIKMPKFMYSLEDKIRNTINKSIKRGKIDVYINYSTNSKEDYDITFNEALADIYVEKFEFIKGKYNAIDDISVSLISNIKDLFIVENQNIDKDLLYSVLKPALYEAVEHMSDMRKKEGGNLKKDLEIKLNNIDNIIKDIEENTPCIVKEHISKMKKRLKDYINNEIDNDRLMTELAIFADKSCIDEEVVRLNSHVIQARELLDSDIPVGKKLDFIVQEMNRETNTIVSKVNTLDIKKYAIELKNEIEKIREQIQNIE